MTERGLPHADGAPACPFVAFDDDRDERSSVPDHRHRCFAEATPAPRALAHQEAYCLSSAFPVCPTFQDWARREAARSRDGGRAAGVPARPADRGTAPPPVVAPELARAASAATTDDAADDDFGPGGPAEDRAGTAAGLGAGAGLAAGAGAAAAATGPDPDAFDDDEPDGRSSSADSLAQRNPPRDWAAPPPWLASDEAKRRRGEADAEPPSFLGRRTEPGQGLAGSAADRMAGGPSVPPERADRPRERDADEEWTSAARPAGRPRPAPPPEDLGDDDEGEDEPPRRPTTRRPRAYAQHLGGPDGPDWERPRRYEAYPTIRTRVGLPRMRLPPIALMGGALLLAALALFFLPGLLNLGGSPKPSGSTGPVQSAVASASPAPSVSVAPTPELYTIKKGDTLSKIAAAHGITVDQLLAANPAIKDPNKISLGQQLVIPSPSEAPPDTVGGSTAP